MWLLHKLKCLLRVQCSSKDAYTNEAPARKQAAAEYRAPHHLNTAVSVDALQLPFCFNSRQLLLVLLLLLHLLQQQTRTICNSKQMRKTLATVLQHRGPRRQRRETLLSVHLNLNISCCCCCCCFRCCWC